MTMEEGKETARPRERGRSMQSKGENMRKGREMKRNIGKNEDKVEG